MPIDIITNYSSTKLCIATFVLLHLLRTHLFIRVWCKEVSSIFVQLEIPTNHRPQAFIGNFLVEERNPSLTLQR